MCELELCELVREIERLDELEAVRVRQGCAEKHPERVRLWKARRALWARLPGGWSRGC